MVLPSCFSNPSSPGTQCRSRPPQAPPTLPAGPGSFPLQFKQSSWVGQMGLQPLRPEGFRQAYELVWTRSWLGTTSSRRIR